MKEKIASLLATVLTYKSMHEEHYKYVGEHLYKQVFDIQLEVEDYENKVEEKWKKYYQEKSKTN